MDIEDVGEVRTISSKFKWQISDFFCMCCTNIGDFLRSPKFMASTDPNDAQWYLILYPRGNTVANKDFLSLYIYATAQVEAVCNFKILNNRNEVVLNYTTEEYEFGKISWGCGYEKLLSTDFIRNPMNGMLNNGSLTILCEIMTMPQYIVKEIRFNQEVDEEEADIVSRLKVLDIYEDLLNDKKFSDVSLISQGKVVKVHKCILAKNSSVFATMFHAEMKEKSENTVEVADIKYDVLVEMIRFIYAGKVRNLDMLAGELAVAADKYALEDLKVICEKRMIQNLSLDNVIDCLQLADKLLMHNLKENAIEFIVDNASEITAKPEFELLPAEILRKVICYGLVRKNKQ